MKKVFLSSMLLFSLLTPAMAQAAAPTHAMKVKTVQVKTVTVNKYGHVTIAQKVYTSASTKAKILGSLKKNENVYIYSSQNGWYKIKYGSKKGYIPTKSTKIGKYSAPTTPATPGKKFSDGWVAPVLKSKWTTSNLDYNTRIFDNELGFKDNVFGVPGCVDAIVFGEWTNYEVVIKFATWHDPVLRYSYRIPIVSKELFKFYFENDANRVWNYFDEAKIPNHFVANGRQVDTEDNENEGYFYMFIKAKK